MKYAIMKIDGDYYPARLEDGKYKLFKYGPFNIFTVKFEFYFDAREFIEVIHDSYKKWVIEEIKL